MSFHLALHEKTPDRWAGQEDNDGKGEPIRFECFWIPLERGHILEGGLGTLLPPLRRMNRPRV